MSERSTQVDHDKTADQQKDAKKKASFRDYDTLAALHHLFWPQVREGWPLDISAELRHRRQVRSGSDRYQIRAAQSPQSSATAGVRPVPMPPRPR
jgi:hypothetical protein